MSEKTWIAWTDATWNPIVGCSIVSPACTNCYAMAQAARIERMSEGAGVHKTHYSGTTKIATNGKHVWTGMVKISPARIFYRPLKWRKPRRIFVNSMSDLFHDDVSDKTIDQVFAVMAMAPQHVFQVLTKRPERMRKWVDDRFTKGCRGSIEHRARQIARDVGIVIPCGKTLASPKPFPHVWLGVTAENQYWADKRIPELLATPAAKRFLSVEPMLGPVDLRGWETHDHGCAGEPGEQVPRLDWVICGTESGAGARPMREEWARSLRNQCAATGVAFFNKQMHISGRVVKDVDRFPTDLRVQEFPESSS